MVGNTKKRHLGKRSIFALAAATLLLFAIPFLAQAWNDMQTPSYDWYSQATGTQDDPYKIGSVRDYRGFVNVVNGTVDLDNDGTNDSDSFAGKYVLLTANLDLRTAGESNVIDPIGGGQTGKTFDGTFDGNGHTIDGFTVTAAAGAQATNLGLFGACGEGSVIKNLTAGSSAKLQINKGKTDVIQIKNVGVLVGFSAGSVENCTNNGSVYLQTDYNQTKQIIYTIQNAGGVAGYVLGNVTNCTNNGKVEAYANGNVRAVTEEESEAGEEEETILIMNTGGVVGCAGAMDHRVDADSGDAFGTVSNCTNNGKLSLNTPSSAGLDRFDSPVYAESINTGGVAGYSRGSVLNCTNNGYVRAENGTYAAGVVGCVRGRSNTVSAMAPTVYYDDGMVGASMAEDYSVTYDEAASEAGTIYIRYCVNNADVMGNSSPGGVVGCAGTYTIIEGCSTTSNAIVIATRWNKPFPAGIVSSTRGIVRYCANFGTIVSGTWDNEAERTYTLEAGYYVSGIAGNTRYYETKTYQRISPIPEVYGCYNVGKMEVQDNMRSRGIVGDNAGNVHNNLLVQGVVYNDRLVYGMYEGDDEAYDGVFSNNYVISASLLKSGDWFKLVSTDAYLVEADSEGTMNALTVLNGYGDTSGWDTYWVQSNNGANNGYPVLNVNADWSLTSIANAQVSLKANASYTSVTGSVPQATVTLDGKTLVQNVDYKVIPDATAVDISTGSENPTPYTATIVGIGNYTGTAQNTLSYGIGVGDIATCTVTIEGERFNWEAHELKAESITVTNMAGSVVDPSEYTFAFDETDPDLTVNEETGKLEAVDAARYTVNVTAVEGGHFTNSVTGTFSISAVSIMYSSSEETRETRAVPTAITYAGETYDWESTVALSSKPADQQIPAVTFEYTGHSIDPDVTTVTYKGQTLVEGRDYRLMYGDYELLESGQTIPAGTENIGVKGGTGYGFIMVKSVPGSNFNNYDIMKFAIVDTEAQVSLDGAEIRGTEDVIYEGEQAYEPVTVWYQNQQLTLGVDYDITYTNNTGLGTASFTVTACEDGPFEGTLTGSFNIVEGQPYSFYYTYDSDTMTATVTGVSYHGINDSFDMVIPATTEFAGGEYDKITYGTSSYSVETATAVAGTYKVVAIGDHAFGGCSTRGTGWDWIGSDFALSKAGIRSVSIPYTVRRIGAAAFAGGSIYADGRLLSSVTFADQDYSQLEYIGNFAFQACSNLTEFTFPAQVSTIGMSAFRVGTLNEPSKITKLTFLTEDPSLPSSVSAEYAFAGVGGKKSGEVAVYANESATAVKNLIQANSNSSSYGSNKGMRFTYYELETPERTWSVETSSYCASGMRLVTHEAPSASSNATYTVNGKVMYQSGSKLVALVTAEEAALLRDDSFAFAESSAKTYEVLDVNGNGSVNIVDAQIAYDLAAGGVYSDFSELSEGQWLAADANGDGYVDAADAQTIQNFIMGKITAAELGLSASSVEVEEATIGEVEALSVDESAEADAVAAEEDEAAAPQDAELSAERDTEGADTGTLDNLEVSATLPEAA